MNSIPKCAASLARVPPNLHLQEENLRGYVVLLSAHFQGFCRDLYVESSQVVVSRVRPTLQFLIQSQFTDHYALDHGNPNLQNLRRDFERFDFTLDLAAADPGNPVRLQHLNELNRWRNIAAHQGVVPPTGLPSLADLQDWKDSCNGLARSLDGMATEESTEHEMGRIAEEQMASPGLSGLQDRLQLGVEKIRMDSDVLSQALRWRHGDGAVRGHFRPKSLRNFRTCVSPRRSQVSW